MIVIGLTGSLASGKSEVASIFRKYGAKVFDADHIAKRLVRRGSMLNRSIGLLFGRDFHGENGELDRKKLARHVFSSPKDLKKLNTLIHPEVMLEALETIRRLKDRGERVLVLDVPLLFESRMDGLAGMTVVVKSKKDRLIQCAGKKGISASLAKQILSNQWPSAKKERLADFVIENNGSLKDLRERAREVFFEILLVYGMRGKDLTTIQGGKAGNGY